MYNSRRSANLGVAYHFKVHSSPRIIVCQAVPSTKELSKLAHFANHALYHLCHLRVLLWTHGEIFEDLGRTLALHLGTDHLEALDILWAGLRRLRLAALHNGLILASVLGSHGCQLSLREHGRACVLLRRCSLNRYTRGVGNFHHIIRTWPFKAVLGRYRRRSVLLRRLAVAGLRSLVPNRGARSRLVRGGSRGSLRGGRPVGRLH